MDSPCKIDKKEIKTIEDISLNAWPSHQMQIYDGWILRFSHFYTHRTNCVEQIGTAFIPIEEKTAYCEKIYKRWNSPCIFKITPLTHPTFDPFLQKRGYEIQHETDVMCRDLIDVKKNCAAQRDDPVQENCQAAESYQVQENFQAAENYQPQENCYVSQERKNLEQKYAETVCIERRITDEWIDALFTIKGNATVTHLKIVPSMYAAIPKDVFCVYIRKDNRIVCTGLGILDREYIGLYAINVEKKFRRRGYAEQVCRTLLAEGKKAGVAKAYLQVVSDNAPAIALYRKLGFEKQYRYWFRVRG